jgi:fructose-1,6-bisphosphatase I
VKKLDILADEVWVNALRHTGRVCIMASEEHEDVITVPLSEAPDARYSVVFDPLDGSSNIDCNVSVGSIFGVYRRVTPVGTEATLADVLQPGTALVAAGYCMYGSSTEMVFTVGNGLQMFSYDPMIGEFLMTRRDVTIPSNPQKIYSCNEGNYNAYPLGLRRFLDNAKLGAKPYSLRYVGSMVADIHRTLLYGGVFMYGSTNQAPEGKLRLLYEVNPMSWMLEQAGGKSIRGLDGRPLDVVPTRIHERSPVYLGCTRDVDLIHSYLKQVHDEEAGHVHNC